MDLKEQKRPKMLKDLTLLDRFLFDEVLEDRETYEAVLEIILGRDIRLRESPQSEKEVRTLPSYRGIRMDVWGQDESDTVYNSEMQKRNTKNLPKRSRYYQAALDCGLLEPGSVDFNRLNDACLITIAPFDLFGLDRCVYTFRMRCDEAPELSLDDGAVRLFLYTKGTRTEGVSQELLEFLNYVECTDEGIVCRSQSPRLRCLHRRVTAVKNSESSEVRYMQLWEEKALERQEGKAEGKAEGLAEGLEAGISEGIRAFILDKLEEEVPEELILDKLQKHFSLSREAAVSWLEKFR